VATGPTRRRAQELKRSCSGCGDRPCHQFGCAGRRADEHLSWRDPTGGHAEQHRRVPCGGHFARYRKRTAAGSPLREESELRRCLHPTTRGLQLMRKIFAWVTDDYDIDSGERVVMNDRELPGTVLRLPMVYGPGDPLRRFYPLVKRIADGRPPHHLSRDAGRLALAAGLRGERGAAIALGATDDRAARRIYNVCEEPSFSDSNGRERSPPRCGGMGILSPAHRAHAPALAKAGNAAQHLDGKFDAYPRGTRVRGIGDD